MARPSILLICPPGEGALPRVSRPAAPRQRRRLTLLFGEHVPVRTDSCRTVSTLTEARLSGCRSGSTTFSFPIITRLSHFSGESGRVVIDSGTGG